MAMKRVYRLVKKVNKSVKATDMLIEKARKKLFSDCPTRWEFYIFNDFSSVGGEKIHHLNLNLYLKKWGGIICLIAIGE